MNKLILLITMFPLLATAKLVHADRSETLTNSSLKLICTHAASNHLSDLRHVNELYQQLKSLTQQNTVVSKSEQVHALVNEIHEYSKRIQYLSRPEWNSENIQIELSWFVKHELLYDESEFLTLKGNLLNSLANGSLDYLFKSNLPSDKYVSPLNSFIGYLNLNNPIDPDLGVYLVAANTRSAITSKKLLKSYFLNSEREDVQQHFILNPKIMRSEADMDYGFVIKYKKNVTALEACQMLDTLLFEVEVGYTVYEADPFDPTQKIKIEKKDIIYLTPRSDILK